MHQEDTTRESGERRLTRQTHHLYAMEIKKILALCLVDIKLSSFNPSQNNLHDAGKKSTMQD